ncbi:MAG: hypothetical protein K0S17_2473 [Enterobacter mori]|nr:hypothetical protein [Enterobacter mori]
MLRILSEPDAIVWAMAHKKALPWQGFVQSVSIVGWRLRLTRPTGSAGLLTIQRRTLANGYTLRRDGFRHVAEQVDMQQPVGKRCAGHFHMVCQGKAQAKRLINQPLMQPFGLGLLFFR